MSFDCEWLDDDRLAAFLNGCLSEGEFQQLELHLATCDRCLQAVSELREASLQLDDKVEGRLHRNNESLRPRPFFMQELFAAAAEIQSHLARHVNMDAHIEEGIAAEGIARDNSDTRLDAVPSRQANCGRVGRANTPGAGDRSAWRLAVAGVLLFACGFYAWHKFELHKTAPRDTAKATIQPRRESSVAEHRPPAVSGSVEVDSLRHEPTLHADSKYFVVKEPNRGADNITFYWVLPKTSGETGKETF